jgi:hypothetical protein
MMTFDDSRFDPRRKWAAAAQVGRGGGSRSSAATRGHRNGLAAIRKRSLRLSGEIACAVKAAHSDLHAVSFTGSSPSLPSF